MEERKFTEICEKFRPKLEGKAGRYIPGVFAEEMAQDAIVYAWEHRIEMQSGAEERELRKWLYTILHHLCMKERLRFSREAQRTSPIDEYVQEEVRSECSKPSLITTDFQDTLSPEEMALREKLEEIRVRMRYAKVTDEERVVLLGYADKLPTKEIAEQIQQIRKSEHPVCGNTVRNIRERAIKRIRDCDATQALTATDMSVQDRSYIWTLGKPAPGCIYFAPQTVGSGVARQQLAKMAAEDARNHRICKMGGISK